MLKLFLILKKGFNCQRTGRYILREYPAWRDSFLTNLKDEWKVGNKSAKSLLLDRLELIKLVSIFVCSLLSPSFIPHFSDSKDPVPYNPRTFCLKSKSLVRPKSVTHNPSNSSWTSKSLLISLSVNWAPISISHFSENGFT